MPGATPISHWIGFHLFILALLAIELIYARRQGPAKTHSTAIASTILWVAAALAFALFIFHTLGSQSTTQYLAGYAIEESLSVDNLFVFLILFRVFKIEPNHQPKVLFWGVAGAILMRGAFIAAGLGLLARFDWISYALRRHPAHRRHPPRSSLRPKDGTHSRAGSNGSPASTPSASARTSSSSAKTAAA